MKKILALVLIMVLALTAAAFAEGEATTLRIAHKADPTSLCHLTVTFGSANGPIDAVIYDRLLDYDQEANDVAPMLATAWEFIDDTHVRFTLRDDVVAHDGSKFTANDVIYTLTAGQESGMLANYYGNFDLAECKAEDDYTVIVATTTPDPYVLYNLSNIPLGMVCQASVEATGLEAQALLPTCGTGPYKVVEWVNGSYVKLARNEEYWGEKPGFDFVEFQIIGDASARVMALESGSVDVCLEPANSQLPMMEDNGAFKVINYETAQVTTMYLNCTKAPFDDVKVRQAVASAINYEGDLRVAVGAYGTTTDSFLPIASTAYCAPDGSYENFYSYDVDRAKALMAESGYPDGCDAELMIMEGSAFGDYAALIKDQLAEIGINVEIVPTASSAFYDILSAGGHQMEIVNSSNPDPAVQCKYFDYRVGFASVRGGTGWQGPAELDALIDEAKAAIDTEARNELYKQIQAIINTNAPAIPLYSPNKTAITGANIDGVRLTEFGDIDVSRAVLVG